MTVTAYCKYADLSRKQFYHHKKSVALGGCFTRKPGKKKDSVIKENADIALLQNVSRKTQKGGSATKKKFKQKVDADVKQFVHDVVVDLAGLPLSELQRRHELEKLLIRQIERRTLENDYILAVDVDKQAFDAGLQIRESLESIPVRIAPLLAVESRRFECQQILEKEINHILINLSNILALKGKSNENGK